MQAKPVVFEELPGEKPTLINTIGKNSRCMRKIKNELVPHAIAYLGYRWSSCVAGGAMSSLLRHVVETHNIGGVASKYQELMDNDGQQELPLIRKLRNGHNKLSNSIVIK